MKFLRFYFLLLIFLFSTSANAEVIGKTSLQQIDRVFTKLFPDYKRISTESKQVNPGDLELVYQSKSNRIKLVKIQIVNSNLRNAYALSSSEQNQYSHIIITSSLIKEKHSDDKLSFTLAHEMAHLMKGHQHLNLGSYHLTQSQKNELNNLYKKWEKEADDFAKNLLNSTGYNTNNINSFLTELDSLNKEINPNISQTHHPVTDKRLALKSLSNHNN